MSHRIAMAEFMRGFAISNVELPSAEEVHGNGAGLSPILFDKDGVMMLAIFTDKSRIGAYVERAPYCVSMKAIDVMRRLPPGVGIVVNPGFKLGFDISPEGIKEVLRDFG